MTDGEVKYASKSSQTVTWDSRIESDANRLRQQILLDLDFESWHRSKDSEDIGLSTSPFSILDASSVNTGSDSNPGGVLLQDKFTLVGDQVQWTSDCEELYLILMQELLPVKTT